MKNDDFENKEYRDAFVAENISTGIAFQIRALRRKEHWSQEELGRKAGKPQNVISRLENPDYGKFTLNTLLALATAFDVALMVRFVPFSALQLSLNHLSEDALGVLGFEEEKRAASVTHITGSYEWTHTLDTHLLTTGEINFGTEDLSHVGAAISTAASIQ